MRRKFMFNEILVDPLVLKYDVYSNVSTPDLPYPPPIFTKYKYLDLEASGKPNSVSGSMRIVRMDPKKINTIAYQMGVDNGTGSGSYALIIRVNYFIGSLNGASGTVNLNAIEDIESILIDGGFYKTGTSTTGPYFTLTYHNER